MKFLVKIILVAASVCYVQCNEIVLGLKHLISKEDHTILKNYVQEVINVTSESLRIPAVLAPATTPEQFLVDESTGSTHQVMIGIVIENYSKFVLSDPRTSGKSNCVKNREITPLQPVFPGTYEILAIDNDRGYLQRSVCGSISFQINKPDGIPVKDTRANSIYGRRLVITYEVPYSSSCDADHRNSFTVNIRKEELNGTYHWKFPDFSTSFYSNHINKKFSNWLYGANGHSTVLGTFDQKRFVVRGHMSGGCKAILKIQFLPGVHLRNKMLFNSASSVAERPSTTTVLPTVSQETLRESHVRGKLRNQTEENLSTLAEAISEAVVGPAPDDKKSSFGLSKFFTIGLIVLGSIFVSVVLMSICIVVVIRRRRKSKEKFFRRPYRQ